MNLSIKQLSQEFRYPIKELDKIFKKNKLELSGGKIKSKYKYTRKLKGSEAIYDKNISLKNTIELLDKKLTENKVSPCHGIEHAKKVMINAYNALNSDLKLKKYTLSADDQSAVLLAALLHDADDGKFFPNNKDYDNLREILKANERTNEFIDKVVYMVSIVSSSKNGDTIPPPTIGKEWMLIPRYADRLEAIGIIGIKRCYIYNKNVSNVPLFLPETKRGKTEKELWEIASVERYEDYNGSSKSMIDHYYDKLLRLSIFPIRNKFFDKECKKRRKPLIDLLLLFGKNDNITDDEINTFINKKI